jgi:hypothetical protein
MLFQDIGLDQDGYMENLVERGTPLPHEMSCQIQLNGNVNLALYEGNRVNITQNRLLGTYTLENADKDGVFVFTLQISETYVMKVLIDDRLVDTVECTQVEDDILIEDTRIWLNAKKEFMDYVQSTLLFLQDPLTQQYVPEWKDAIEKLEWAKQIVDYPVTTEEYIVALHEIETMINPLLQNTLHKKERKDLEPNP